MASVNVPDVQRQIKAFNKALSRAKAKGTTKDVLNNINNLIDYDRMTRKMYAKAGKGFLESLSAEELLAYSSDIERAKELIEVGNWASRLNIAEATDPLAFLWKMCDELKAKGLPFDSDQIKAIQKGEVDVDWRDMAKQMEKYMNNPDYLLSDVEEWWEKATGLEG